MVVPQVRPRCTHREEAAAAAEEGGAPQEVSETSPRPGWALLPTLLPTGPSRSCPRDRSAGDSSKNTLSFACSGPEDWRRWWLLGVPRRAAVAIQLVPGPRPRAESGAGGCCLTAGAGPRRGR